jgi:probable rRNA maturation factor
VIELSIAWNGWRTARASAEAQARAALAAVQAELGAAAPADGGIALLLTDADSLRRLNRDWRGKDKATNVLAFPADAPALPDGPPCFLGDIAIAGEVVEAEAAAQGKRVTAHFCHLVVHGVLHLMGYDHETDAEAAIMEDLERRILDRLGIADPYAEADPIPAQRAQR